MTDQEKLKAMMKELNLTNHKIAAITGHGYTSVNSMLSPGNRFPRWMKLVIYVWEETRTELKEVKKLNEQLIGGQKLLLERIDDLHTNEDYKKLEESIKALLILIDSRLHLIDGEIIGKGKSLIWKGVVKTAQDLIKEKL